MRQNIYDDDTFFAGYRTLRAAPDTYNTLVEQPALRALLPPLIGKRVLDLGCGFGDLAAYCVEQGAACVTATDISAKMLARAQQQNGSPQITYVQSALEDLDFTPGLFDVVVSSLALHYVADYRAAITNVAHWLVPGGTFVFSVEHPIFTARRTGHQEWQRDDAGQKSHWPVDDYADEGRREFTWFVGGVVKYHRTLSTLLNALVQNDLAVTALREPSASEETIARLPQYASTRRSPPFLVVQSRK